jgi:hypothetical protein
MALQTKSYRQGAIQRHEQQEEHQAIQIRN